MSDTFTNDQFKWLRQVAHDIGLSATASRVAIALTQYFNRKRDGWAWMSQATLAQELGVTDRAVRSALADLVDHGHLVTKRRGRTETNLYHLNIKNEESDRKESAGHDRNESSDHPPSSDRKEYSDHPPVTGRNTSSDRKKTVKVTGTDLPTNPLNEPTEDSIDVEVEPTELRVTAQLDLGAEILGGVESRFHGARFADVDFEKFWVQVPRKVAKPKAAQLFKRIVKNREATVDELMAGILRYSAEVANREERYIAYPSTWLSQGRWADEPAQPIGATIIDTYGNEIVQPPDHRRRATATPSWTSIATKRVQP